MLVVWSCSVTLVLWSLVMVQGCGVYSAAEAWTLAPLVPCVFVQLRHCMLLVSCLHHVFKVVFTDLCIKGVQCWDLCLLQVQIPCLSLIVIMLYRSVAPLVAGFYG